MHSIISNREVSPKFPLAVKPKHFWHIIGPETVLLESISQHSHPVIRWFIFIFSTLYPSPTLPLLLSPLWIIYTAALLLHLFTCDSWPWWISSCLSWALDSFLQTFLPLLDHLASQNTPEASGLPASANLQCSWQVLDHWALPSFMIYSISSKILR